MNKTLSIFSIVGNVVVIILLIIVLINQNFIRKEIASIKIEASSTNIKLDYVESDINKGQYDNSIKK